MTQVKWTSAFLRRLKREEDGQGMVEYGTIVTLIAVGVLSLLSLLYDQVAAIYGQVATALQAVLDIL